jgi:hypothetical protein
MGSLVTLINRAAARAIITGAEAITEQVLDDTVIDIAAENQRNEAAAKRRNRNRGTASRARHNPGNPRVSRSTRSTA